MTEECVEEVAQEKWYLIMQIREKLLQASVCPTASEAQCALLKQASDALYQLFPGLMITAITPCAAMYMRVGNIAISGRETSLKQEVPAMIRKGKRVGDLAAVECYQEMLLLTGLYPDSAPKSPPMPERWARFDQPTTPEQKKPTRRSPRRKA